MHYFGGIITSDACKTAQDHAMLAVGYGVENSQGYFILKNSWGNKWGEDGYVRIGFKDDGPGVCGILQHGIYP